MRFSSSEVVAIVGGMSMVSVYSQGCSGKAKCGSIVGGLEFAEEPIDPAAVECMFGVTSDIEAAGESCGLPACGETLEYECFCISESMAQENLSPTIRKEFWSGILGSFLFLLVFLVHAWRFKMWLRKIDEIEKALAVARSTGFKQRTSIYTKEFETGYCTWFLYLLFGVTAGFSFRDWIELRSEGFWVGCGSLGDEIPLGN